MTALFQQLPSVDKFLKTPEGEMLLTEFGHSAVVRDCANYCLRTRVYQTTPKLTALFCRSSEYIALFTRTIDSTKSCAD